MKILLLGYSSISRRRVLPALAKCGVRQIDIASQSQASFQWPDGLSGRRFRDYDDALRNSDAELVYVSTVNSLHGRWARNALEAGFHVAVDKPITLSFQETRALLEAANRRERCLAEVLTYGYHPQVQRALRVFEEHGVSPSRLVASFSFPPLRPDNFRYRRDLGGGALLDLGPYAASMGRIFFLEAPTEVTAQCMPGTDDLEVSFEMMARYPGSRSAIGAFGFTTGYINRLELLGHRVTVTIDRAFTPPPADELTLIVRVSDEVSAIPIPAANSFGAFFEHLFSAIAEHRYDIFARSIESDARALARLRENARSGALSS